MPTIVDIRPIIHTKLYSKPNYYFQYHHHHTFSYFCCPRATTTTLTSNFIKSFNQKTSSRSFRDISLNCHSDQSTQPDPTDPNKNPNPNPKGENNNSNKNKKGNRKFNSNNNSTNNKKNVFNSIFNFFKDEWEGRESLKAEDFVGIAAFFILLRFLRPGGGGGGIPFPLPGYDPRGWATVVSVPYSEFLSKVNGNLVGKVEVDGVNIMFKLRSSSEDGGKVSEVGKVGKAGKGWKKRESGVDKGVVEKGEDVELLRSVTPTRKIVYSTTRPVDIVAPYEKMLENNVVFGSPDKQSGGFFKTAMIAMFYVAVLAGLLHRFPINFSQSSTGQLRMRKSGGSSKVAELGDSITFADVAGVDEAKEELEEIVEFLRNPDKYARLGARPPRGVLLVGLPGTGKTLLAKAVAGEADVPFISCSASEFVELYVGMGALRVRELFSRAKKEAPSIIFIDEIDAVAKTRDSKYRVGSNDEREQTLNQLLTEMDGFDSSSAVIVLGATNRADVLDPALRRPGRFDRVVMVEAPDRLGRESILRVHASKKELPLEDDVDLSEISCMTTGFTGADLANLVNEAALLAGRKNKVVVEREDFIQAVERSLAGIEKKTTKLKGNEKAVVARHEVGHAVVGTAVANLLSGQPRVEKLSILPRTGGALGFTYIPPTSEDRYLLFVDELRGRLVTLLGGRAAEEVVYAGRVSTGALDDIRRATDMAYKAVAEYGLSQSIGPVSVATLSAGGDDSGGGIWGNDQGHLVDLVQREVKTLLQSALDVALCVVRANPTVLEGLGTYLEEKEKVEGQELQEWLNMVVAPAELSAFMQGRQESFLPLQVQPILE